MGNVRAERKVPSSFLPVPGAPAQVITSIESITHEQTVWMPAHINERKHYRCEDFEGHVWVNGQLYFQRGTNLRINLLTGEWGHGYGAIRYCKACKLIDCIHRFEQEDILYKVEEPRHDVIYRLGYCWVCGLHIIRHVWGVSKMLPRVTDPNVVSGLLEEAAQ